MQLSFVIFGVIENGFAEALAAEVLDKLFDGDMEAAKQCQNDYLSLLDIVVMQLYNLLHYHK